MTKKAGEGAPLKSSPPSCITLGVFEALVEHFSLLLQSSPFSGVWNDIKSQFKVSCYADLRQDG
jgi:hypothetical protein